MTIIEALQFCKATGRAVCRPGSLSTHVKWDLDWTYKFSGDDILADDWEDAETYMSGKPPLKQGGLKGMSPQDPAESRIRVKCLNCNKDFVWWVHPVQLCDDCVDLEYAMAEIENQGP